MGASDRRKLWICRFAWTTQTRCPHTHSSDRKKRRKRLEDSFEEEENRNGRRLYTLISTVPGPTDGVHLNPPAFTSTPGQVHDITQAETLTSQVQPEALLADKGYDADAYIASLRARAIQPVIPPKANRKNKRDCDFALYRERNLVERFFQFIKQFRGIATRYEKTARNFSAGLQLVCALAWLK